MPTSSVASHQQVQPQQRPERSAPRINEVVLTRLHWGADPARESAQAVAELFFYQLFSAEAAIIDARPAAFHAVGDTLVWRPAPLHARWKPGFVDALRRLYNGLLWQMSDVVDEALFDLKLDVAEREVRRALLPHGPTGSGKIDARQHCNAVLHALGRVRSAALTPHENLTPFLFWLGATFETLAALGSEVDLAAAYFRVTEWRP